jgi:hypothetical protein
MPHYLLLGAGFSRNWGGPLSEEITGSLLGELHDDAALARALRNGPFEDAFQGFAPAAGPVAAGQRRFEAAITGVFSRLNKTFVTRQFEFCNDIEFSIKNFLARFDAIFTLNQDLLLEIHYVQTFIQQRRFSSVILPGLRLSSFPAAGTGPYDLTMTKWRATDDFTIHQSCQPLFKLHGSTNWETEAGEPLLIMGNAKSGAIRCSAILRHYHDAFAARLRQGNARLMVIGYSFQDEHINNVIERASREHGLGTYLVDPNGLSALRDPKMDRAAIRVSRDIENIKLVGELRRPLSGVFGGDAFAHGELMRFFRQ